MSHQWGYSSMLNVSPESREGGDVTFSVRGFWMVSTFRKVRVIGQMRVQAVFGVRVLMHMSVSEKETDERQRRQRKRR